MKRVSSTENKTLTKKYQFAMAVLALGLATSASAAPNLTKKDEIPGPYYGVGVGSIVGAVLAGPPGALAGAALGGVFGWGDDHRDHLVDAQASLEAANTDLEKSELAFNRKEGELKAMRSRVAELSRVNAQQTARISELLVPRVDSEIGELKEVLQDVAEHYTQEVYFRKGESNLPGHVSPRIDELSKFLIEHPSLNVTVTGFADHRGTDQFNLNLAGQRAKTIQELLVERGVAENRVQLDAKGESALLSQPGDASNYVLDRRVTIQLSIPEEENYPVASTSEVAE